MNYGLLSIKSRRAWLVREFVVWGLPGLGDMEYLALQTADGAKSIHFGSVNIGDASQSVSFANLQDVRGANLPAAITRPVVIPRARSGDNVFIVGDESSTSFKIARDSSATGPVTVDLFVVELGQ